MLNTTVPILCWQRQQHVSSVQEQLENALSKICNEKIVVTCAGRTDAGVRGTGQVVHFDTTAERAMVSFTWGECQLARCYCNSLGTRGK